jgi:hypothetical protein
MEEMPADTHESAVVSRCPYRGVYIVVPTPQAHCIHEPIPKVNILRIDGPNGGPRDGARQVE